MHLNELSRNYNNLVNKHSHYKLFISNTELIKPPFLALRSGDSQRKDIFIFAEELYDNSTVEAGHTRAITVAVIPGRHYDSST